MPVDGGVAAVGVEVADDGDVAGVAEEGADVGDPLGVGVAQVDVAVGLAVHPGRTQQSRMPSTPGSRMAWLRPPSKSRRSTGPWVTEPTPEVVPRADRDEPGGRQPDREPGLVGVAATDADSGSVTLKTVASGSRR